jgi:rhamnosyltransferase subunit B
MWALRWEREMAPAMRPTYELIRDRSQQQTVVVAHWTAFGARLAEERLGVPSCTVYLSPEALNSCDETRTLAPSSRGFSEDDVFGPLLNQYRSDLGLAPVDHICSRWVHSPRQGLALFPAWFGGYQPYWPPQVTLTGFVTCDEAIMPTSMQRVEAFLSTGVPPIVFTPGTETQSAVSFFNESLSACAALGARAILLTPHCAHVPPDLPPWALHVDYIPLNTLLRRASAIVHHGGIGTCAQAIRAGVPQLVAPMVWDQFDNAQHVRALNLGVSVPMKDYREGVATDKLIQLLSGNGIRHACQRLAAQFAQDNPLETICGIIERL